MKVSKYEIKVSKYKMKISKHEMKLSNYDLKVSKYENNMSKCEMKESKYIQITDISSINGCHVIKRCWKYIYCMINILLPFQGPLWK